MEIKVRAIITGATGMVGEGVLHECLPHRDVEARNIFKNLDF